MSQNVSSNHKLFFYFRSMGIADKLFHVVLLHDPQGFLKIPNAFVPVMELLYGMKEISLWLDLVDKRNYELMKKVMVIFIEKKRFRGRIRNLSIFLICHRVISVLFAHTTY